MPGYWGGTALIRLIATGGKPDVGGAHELRSSGLFGAMHQRQTGAVDKECFLDAAFG